MNEADSRVVAAARCAALVVASCVAVAGSPVTDAAAANRSGGAAGWAAVAQWPAFMGGVWGSGAGAGGPDERSDLPQPRIRPEYQEQVRAAQKAYFTSGSASCDPHGIPVDIGGQFFFTKDAIFLMADLDYFITRHIYMDGRGHGTPDPSYYGHSIGHWEGDTLVVDTVGFLPEVVVTMGLPGQGRTHVVERFRLTGPDRMELTLTVENPAVLLAPWTTTRTLTRHPDWEIHEAYCTQNNRETPVDGVERINLTPPK